MESDRNGFTLLELILSVAVIGILTGLSIPVYRIMLTKNDLDIATVHVVQSIRRAQIYAQAVDGDTGWGVHIATGASTLFKGATYATRDSSVDEVTNLSPAISVSGLTEIDFAKFTGMPGATGSVLLTTPDDSHTITINAKGIVSY